MRMSAAWRRRVGFEVGGGGGSITERERAAFPLPLLVFISISVSEETRSLVQAGNLPTAGLTHPLQTRKEATQKP